MNQNTSPLTSLKHIRERIERACQRAGREPQDVLLIGAAKTVEAARLREFVEAGLEQVGENYVQEAQAKVLPVGREATTWHLIGALQRNKAKVAVGLFDWIHSIDRVPLARAVNDAAREAGKIQRVLIQVNVAGEASKAGCEPQELPDVLAACCEMENLDVQGLMSLPPFEDDPQQMRPYFQQLRALREASSQSCLRHLSMGMTNDFEVAIEEGATMIRVGTGLFGARDRKNSA
jgi:pyridoxal phosphate enzyme (YggS family)